MPEQDPSDQFVDMMTGGISKLFGILEKHLEERKQRNKANDEKYFAQQRALKDKEEAAELRKQDREFQKAENQKLIDALTGGMKQSGMDPSKENLEKMTQQVERLEEIDAQKEKVQERIDDLGKKIEDIEKQQAEIINKDPVDGPKLRDLSKQRTDLTSELNAAKQELAKLNEEASNIKAGKGLRQPQKQEQAFMLNPQEVQSLNKANGRLAQIKVKADVLDTRLDAITKEQAVALGKTPPDVAKLKDLAKERDLLKAERSKIGKEGAELEKEVASIKEGTGQRKKLQDEQFEKGMTPEGKKRLEAIDTRQTNIREGSAVLNERLENINKEQNDLLGKDPFDAAKFKELSEKREGIERDLSAAQKESARLEQEAGVIKGQAQRNARQVLTPEQTKQRLDAIGNEKTQLKGRTDRLNDRLKNLEKEQSQLSAKDPLTPIDVTKMKELSFQRDELNRDLNQLEGQTAKLDREATALQQGTPQQQQLIQKGLKPEAIQRLDAIGKEQTQLKATTDKLNERAAAINKEQDQILAKTPFDGKKFQELAKEREDVNAKLNTAKEQTAKLDQEASGIKAEALKKGQQVQQQEQQKVGVSSVTSRPTVTPKKPLPQLPVSEEEHQRKLDALKSKQGQDGPKTEVDSDKVKAEKEKLEKQQALEKEQAEKEKLEKQQALEKEKLEKTEKEKLEKQQQIKEENEKRDQQLKDADKRRQERLEKEKLEKEQALEKEKLEKQQALEKEKAEKEKIEKQQALEKEKAEKEKLEKQQQIKEENEKRDQQLKDAEKRHQEKLDSEKEKLKNQQESGKKVDSPTTQQKNGSDLTSSVSSGPKAKSEGPRRVRSGSTADTLVQQNYPYHGSQLAETRKRSQSVSSPGPRVKAHG